MGLNGADSDVKGEHSVIDSASDRLAYLDGSVMFGSETIVVNDKRGGFAEGGITWGKALKNPKGFVHEGAELINGHHPGHRNDPAGLDLPDIDRAIHY